MESGKPEEEVPDYDEFEIEDTGEAKENTEKGGENKLTYTSIHSTSFKDHMLKFELTRALQDCGFEHPSEGKTNTAPHVWREFNIASDGLFS